MYEWGVLPKRSKLYYIYWENGRCALHFFSFMLSYMITQSSFAVILAILIECIVIKFCHLYFKRRKSQEEVKQSENRCADPSYINLLKAINYKRMDRRFYTDAQNNIT